MKKIYIAVITAAMAVSALFAGCTRDMISTFNGIALSAEEYNGGGDKAYISDQRYACWENNDQVKLYVNGTQYDGTISVTYPSGSPRAEAVAPGFSPEAPQVVYAGYPRALFTEGVDFSSSKNITLPRVYNYETSGGNQKITAPMVGKITLQPYNDGDPNPNVLKMYNLCTLLKIRLDAPASGAFTVDSIVVVNTTSGAVLSGNATVSFTGENPSITMTSGYDRQTTGRVMLVFGSNAVAINATKYFYIPVPPLPSGQSLMVYAHNAVTGNWFKKVITTTAAVPGNNIATLPGPATNDPDANYTFHKYIRNSNNSSYINLNGVSPNYGQKMELTFLVESGITGSQYYAGSRLGGTGTIIYYGLVNTRSYNDFRASFLSQDAVVDPANYASTSSNGDGTGTLYMERENNVIYRQAMEIRQEASGYYRGYATFEKLNNNFERVAIVSANTTTYRDASLNEMSGAPDVKVFRVGNTYQPAGMRMYSFRMWDSDGTLLRNFVPAERNSDHAIGVYDMVSKTFITPNGTFTLGD